MDGGNRKVIGFDLDTKAMQKYYPKANWRNGYDDIKKFMTNNGFDWQQGSIYVSKLSIEDHMLNVVVREMIKENPWLNFCMRDCIMANIGKKHSLNSLFDKNYDLRKDIDKQEDRENRTIRRTR